ncbi:hypothetical protein RJT34_22763 [Clitoria ternatea]|uniref:Uncharacterized protein n=1 Tax=Clitoria ternatea TaxID=43366 RepID=A0AAN9IFV6_CLITE
MLQSNNPFTFETKQGQFRHSAKPLHRSTHSLTLNTCGSALITLDHSTSLVTEFRSFPNSELSPSLIFFFVLSSVQI